MESRKFMKSSEQKKKLNIRKSVCSKFHLYMGGPKTGDEADFEPARVS